MWQLGLWVHHKYACSCINLFASLLSLQPLSYFTGCYSTTSNLPKVLDESTEQLRQIKITSSGIPQGVIGKPSNDLGSESSEEEDDEGIEFNEGKARSKAETVEEKRLRKKKLKLQRRVYFVCFYTTHFR